MANLMSRLIVELIDHVSGPAGKAGKSLGGLKGDLKKLEDEAKRLQNFKGLHANFKASRGDFNKAREDVQRYARELRDAKKAVEQFQGQRIKKGDPLGPTIAAGRSKVQELERQLQSARRAVKSAGNDFQQQSQRIKQAWGGINNLNFSQIEAKERSLKAAIEATTKAMEKQKQAAGGRFGSMANGLGTMDRNIKSPTMSRVAGGAVALGGGVGLIDAARFAYGVEYDKNKLEGRAGWSREQVNSYAAKARRYALTTGKAGPSGLRGLLGMAEEYGKSGLSPSAAQGLMDPTVNFSAYGEIEPVDAAKNIIKSSQIFGLPLDNEKNARLSAMRVSDAMSYAANVSSADVRDVFSSYSIAGNYAAMAGLTPEQVAAMAATMVQGGISGDRAGTALRSGLVRMVKPTNDSMAALSELGIDLNDFATSRKEWDPETLMASMSARFGKMKRKGSLKRLQSVVASEPEDMQSALSSFFIEETGSKGAQDQAQISKAIGKFMASQINQLDWEAVVDRLAELKINGAYASRIFDSRQGGNLQALIGGQKLYDEIMGGFNSGQAVGASARGANKMYSGVVKDVGMLTAAVQELSLAAAESGVLRDFASGIRDVTSAINFLSKPSWLATKEVIKPSIANPVDRAKNPVLPFLRSNMITGPTVLAGDYISSKFGNRKDASPMGAAMGSFGVKADTAEAEASLEAVRAKLTEVDGKTASTSISLAGANTAVMLLQQILSLIGKINSSTISPPGARAVHADVGGGHGW